MPEETELLFKGTFGGSVVTDGVKASAVVHFNTKTWAFKVTAGIVITQDWLKLQLQGKGGAG